jgi:hypothetical protein
MEVVRSDVSWLRLWIPALLAGRTERRGRIKKWGMTGRGEE